MPPVSVALAFREKGYLAIIKGDSSQLQALQADRIGKKSFAAVAGVTDFGYNITNITNHAVCESQHKVVGKKGDQFVRL